MRIKEKITKNVATLSISGHMMGGPENKALHDHVKNLLGSGIRKMVIDLKKVKWMNSSGLGILMASWGSVCKEGGNLKLANVTEKVHSLLIITQVITFFETYESVDRAVASFKSELR
jgi:anti-sigma B factor antagonist